MELRGSSQEHTLQFSRSCAMCIKEEEIICQVIVLIHHEKNEYWPLDLAMGNEVILMYNSIFIDRSISGSNINRKRYRIHINL